MFGNLFQRRHKYDDEILCKLSHLPQRPPVNIEFIDLYYALSLGRKKGYSFLLKNISGKFEAGKLSALMGPSGAGKSTLLNVLTGYKTSGINGSILVNGEERNMKTFSKLSCYIMQYDILPMYLTVMESMHYASDLKVGKGMKKSAKRLAVQEILGTLSLWECRGTRVKNLSGGQKKRLAIALELVNNPPIMFFDEPTSGLDSASSFMCIALMKTLANGGRNIICTIHQPSARLFELIDNVYVLVKGQCIYNGKVAHLVSHLSSLGIYCPSYHNPADFVMEVAAGEHGEWTQVLVQSSFNGRHFVPQPSEKRATIAADAALDTISIKTNLETEHTPGPTNTGQGNFNVKKGYSTSFCKQLWKLFLRTSISSMRDPMLTHMRLFSHVFVGLLVGIMYFGIGDDASQYANNASLVFFAVLFAMFAGMMPTITSFPLERNILEREHLNHWYTLPAFFFAKMISDLPFQMLFTGMFAVIVYFMCGQPIDEKRFAKFFLAILLTSMAAQSLGMAIGAGMDIESGVFLGPVTIVPCVLFSGFFLTFDSMPIYLNWLTYISYVRYGFEGAMLSIFGNDRKFGESTDQINRRNMPNITPQEFLKYYSMDKIDYWHDVGALIIFSVFLRTIAYIVIACNLKPK